MIKAKKTWSLYFILYEALAAPASSLILPLTSHTGLFLVAVITGLLSE